MPVNAYQLIRLNTMSANDPYQTFKTMRSSELIPLSFNGELGGERDYDQTQLLAWRNSIEVRSYRSVVFNGPSNNLARKPHE